MMRHRPRFISIVSLLLLFGGGRAEDIFAQSPLVPYSGIWILDPAPELSFPDCQLMVRVDALEGVIYRALSCDEDKIQAEIQTVTSFSADPAAGWTAALGFQVGTTSQQSSCHESLSFFPSGFSYGFDHSLGLVSGSIEPSLFMSSPIGEEFGDFRSGSSIPDLGKNKDCRGIVSRSKLPSQASNSLLQNAARICQLTPDSNGLGCFTQADTFVPSP